MTEFDPKAYWESRLRQSFGLHGVGHHTLGRQYNNWLYRVRVHLFRRIMAKLPLNFAAGVLDVGAGTGFYIERWAAAGVKQITGADITQVVVEELSKKFPAHTFVQADIGADVSALPGQPFDAISAFDVLYHIVDDALYAHAFHNIYSLLKPGGYFVFSDNFLHGETQRGVHQVSRSLTDIEKVVRDAGFEIVERFPMFVLMATPIDSRNPLLKLSWSGIRTLAGFSEVTGFLAGAALYLPERLLIAMLRESPTSEIMICRKRP